MIWVLKNYELYARVLRLSMMYDWPAMTAEKIEVMDQIVRETIALDNGLVWC